MRTFLFLLSTVGFFSSAFAQDVLTIGNGNGPCIAGLPGATVNVPVFIRDVAGTPLGIDQPAGRRIQGFSFQVTPSPASAIALSGGTLAVEVTLAGIASGKSPTVVGTPATATTFGFVVVLQESTNLLPFTSNAAAPGDQVANVAITLSPSVAPGTTINLALDQSLSILSAGGVSESVANGNLALVGGCIKVPGATLSLCPAAPLLSAGATLVETLSINSVQSTPTTIALSSSNPASSTVPSGVVIPAGASSVTFDINGIAPGVSTITSTPPPGLGAAATTATVTVPSAFLTLKLTPSNPVINAVNDSIVETVSISDAQSSETVIALTSSNTQAFPVPATILIPPGATSATFTLTARLQSFATITAILPPMLGSGVASTTVTVGGLPPPLPSPAAAVAVPTLSTWGLIALAFALAAVALKFHT